MIRRYKYIAIAIISIVCFSCKEKHTAEDIMEQEPEKTEVVTDTTQTVVMMVQKCSRLYTAEYKIHKIITHKDVTQLKGSILNKDFAFNLPSSDRKIAIPIDATVKAYIDFNGFNESNVKRNGERIEIILPDPKVQITSTKVNHDKVKKDVDFLRPNFSDEEMTSYERQGRDAIVKSIPNLGIFDMAQNNAAKIFIPMLEQMGYRKENITISFRKDFTLRDLPSIIDRSLERR